MHSGELAPVDRHVVSGNVVSGNVVEHNAAGVSDLDGDLDFLGRRLRDLGDRIRERRRDGLAHIYARGDPDCAKLGAVARRRLDEATPNTDLRHRTKEDRHVTDTAQEVSVARAYDPRARPTVAASPGTFQIVPTRGLPIVALVLVGLIVTIATNRLWAIDFFHVVGGGMWTAIDLFLGFVIGPILGRLSIPARTEFTKRLMPKMILIMPTLVVCTLAAGWQLARYKGYLLTSYSHHGWIVASFIVVAVMAVVALGILEPANVAVLFELKKPQPRGDVIGRLMRRFILTAGVTGAMQIVTLVIMTRIATT
ncbi:MAG: hypothetical protein ACYCTE_09385 [Acidimicrobiales bacterium]